MLRDRTFVNGQYEIFKKIEKGKEREIYKLPYFPDRIVHHAIMQVLEPIWKKTLIADTYSLSLLTQIDEVKFLLKV